MSRFFSDKYSLLTPYTPGEQPQQMKYVKLNTNESPFPPSEKALDYAAANTRPLNLYSDPECAGLNRLLAEAYGLSPDEVITTNGSDEILNFAFMAFCDANTPAVFPDITYGFYPVFAALNGLPYREIPLKEDFSVAPADYYGAKATVFIANPNAPTGIALTRGEIEGIIKANADNVVVVDEAYVDFGGESCIPLIHKYKNLLVTQTFSKSRSLAGARLGYGIACRELIGDLNTIRYSTNPYNINSMTMATGIGVLLDKPYFDANCGKIIENRAYTVSRLRELGFEVLPSSANFVFARTPKMEGGELYRRLKDKGILVRHFDKTRISDFNRITIGTAEQMDILIDALKMLLEV